MNFTRKKAVFVLLVGFVVVVAAYSLVVVDKPQIESVESEWGTVNADRSEVKTKITVDNPRLLRVGDAAATVEFTITLNGIQFASEQEEGVELGGQTDTVRMSTWVNNDKIPEWWVTHVNNDEVSTVTVDPTVELKYGGANIPTKRWTRERTFNTNLLGPIKTDQSRQFTALDQTVLVVNETDARWGNVTAERTPITISATVTNRLPVQFRFSDVRYTVRMNDIIVGQGAPVKQALIPARSTRTLGASAHIDNSKLDEWWVTHLRNSETTNLSVSFTASVKFGGIDRRLPLDFISYNRTFDTDVFGSGTPGTQSESAQTAEHGESRLLPAVGIESRSQP